MENHYRGRAGGRSDEYGRLLDPAASGAAVGRPARGRHTCGERRTPQPGWRAATPTPDAAAGTVPTAAQQALLAQLPSRGPAPELTNDTWFNSAPLRLADLRGKVVMVEFWTYGCINCQHVIPALQGWHATYADDGLVILGIHTPEFRYEAEPANVEAALAQYGVTWPVALDNDKTTWRAYANRYWPAMYLIDKAGNLRYLAIGEGQYAHTEAVIQALLAEAQRLDLPD